ncbi:MAG: NYN domain-containing protein [Candidatus Methylomirabilales bacterium]
MWLIIDGYNVIRQWPELAFLDREDLAAGRAGLLEALRAYRQAKGHRITVVFDGVEQGGLAEGREQVAGIAVRYSRRGERADDLIARLVEEGRGEAMVVVSSDHEVQAAARRCQAAGMDAGEFIDRVEAARLADLKGGEDEERPVKTGKGAARRLPKSVRKAERRLRDV